MMLHTDFNGMNGSRWGFFPAASLGWRMSQEPWLKDVTMAG
jgi:hypothetical protein